MHDEGGAILCSLANKTQHINQIAGTRLYIFLLPTYTSILFSSRMKHTASILNYLDITRLAQHNASRSKTHRITYTTLYVHSGLPSATFQLYYNANTLHVDSFSTRSDGIKGQPQWKEEANCQGKNADIGYKSTPVVGSRLYTGIHLRTHPWTHTDIQCLQRQG